MSTIKRPWDNKPICPKCKDSAYVGKSKKTGKNFCYVCQLPLPEEVVTESIVEDYWKKLKDEAKQKGITKSLDDIERVWRSTVMELQKEGTKPDDPKYKAELMTRTKKKVLAEKKNNFESTLVILQEETAVPTGDFHGGRKIETYTYYGMGGQQITFKSPNKYPEKMSAQDLINLKSSTKDWAYFSKGKLF